MVIIVVWSNFLLAGLLLSQVGIIVVWGPLLSQLVITWARWLGLPRF